MVGEVGCTPAATALKALTRFALRLAVHASVSAKAVGAEDDWGRRKGFEVVTLLDSTLERPSPGILFAIFKGAMCVFVVGEPDARGQQPLSRIPKCSGGELDRG